MKDIIKAEAGEYITRVQLYSASIDRARDRHRRLGFIAGATFGMGLKEKEISALREQLEDQAKIIKELKQKTNI